MKQPSIHFGSLNAPLPDWRNTPGKGEDETDDLFEEDEDAPAPADVAAMVGFDPDEIADDTSELEDATTQNRDPGHPHDAEADRRDRMGEEAVAAAVVEDTSDALLRAFKAVSTSDEQARNRALQDIQSDMESLLKKADANGGTADALEKLLVRGFAEGLQGAGS